MTILFLCINIYIKNKNYLTKVWLRNFSTSVFFLWMCTKNNADNKLTRSCLSVMLIFSTMDQNQRLNWSSLSAFSPVSDAFRKNVNSKSFISELKEEPKKSRLSGSPDSSLKEVKLMSIWTLTSPQPLTSSLKSSAVKSSRAFLGSTSSKPFLIAYLKKKKKIIPGNTHFSVYAITSTSQGELRDFTYMKRLLSHNKHSVFCILPHILIHVKRCYRHVHPTREKLHLVQREQRHLCQLTGSAHCTVLQRQCGPLPVPPLPLYRGQWQRPSPSQQILHLLHRPESGG